MTVLTSPWLFASGMTTSIMQRVTPGARRHMIPFALGERLDPPGPPVRLRDRPR